MELEQKVLLRLAPFMRCIGCLDDDGGLENAVFSAVEVFAKTVSFTKAGSYDNFRRHACKDVGCRCRSRVC